VVTHYLGNHGRRKKKVNNAVRAWSLTQVVGKLHKEEVEDLTVEASGCPKGSTGFFAVYQKVLSKFVTKTLTEEDREKYRKMAQEWTERSPPEAVQQE
jgi:O-acetyl-ADP-ribose deacetylase (regulator of RNase III)